MRKSIHTVKKTFLQPKSTLGQTIFYVTYQWDGQRDKVSVLEEEENVGFQWPVPRWEHPRRYTEEMTDLSQEVQEELLVKAFGIN
jgi:hypothetical protein